MKRIPDKIQNVTYLGQHENASKEIPFTLQPGLLPKHTSRLQQRERSTTPTLEHSSRQSQKTS